METAFCQVHNHFYWIQPLWRHEDTAVIPTYDRKKKASYIAVFCSSQAQIGIFYFTFLWVRRTQPTLNPKQ